MLDPLGLLKSLAIVSSGSADILGVEQVQNILAATLKRLGFATRLIPNPRGPQQSAPLLEATLRGRDSRFITFVSHSDTLGTAQTEGDRFYVDHSAKRVVGQGILDDKASQVVAIAGLERFLKSLGTSQPTYSLRFVASPSEEAGSTGFHDIFKEFGTDSWLALGFEPALENGNIIQSRRGNRWYNIQVTGVEAHSGRAHERGANAAHELAIKIAAIHKLTQYARGVTVSVGHLQGGCGLYNVVCGTAEAKLDTRFSDHRSRDALHKKIESILSRTHVKARTGGGKTKTAWFIEDDCPPFAVDAKSKRLVAEYVKIISRIEGRKVKALASGGAADVCYMSRPGLFMIDGLGATGGNMHRADEFADLESITTRAQALSEFLGFLEKNASQKI